MKSGNDNYITDNLQTPCGVIYVVDEAGKRIPFSVCKNSFDCDYEFESSSGITKKINTDTNFSLMIKTSDLKLHAENRIYLDGIPLDFGCSGERVECVSGGNNGWFIAIGAYSPNDEEKTHQSYLYSKKSGYYEQGYIVEPMKYDESKFEWYDVEMLEDKSGFLFWLIDTKREYIFFNVAWIKCEPDDEWHYEAAVQFWTT